MFKLNNVASFGANKLLLFIAMLWITVSSLGQSAVSPWYDITVYGAVYGASDNGPPIRAAITAAIANNAGTVFFPCGVWNIATPEASNYAALGVYPGNAKITLKGAQEGCAVIKYTGTAHVQAVINMAYSQPPAGGSAPWRNNVPYSIGSSIQDLVVAGVGFNVQDSIDLIRPVEMHFSRVTMGDGAQNSCLYVISGVANKFDEPICDGHNGSWSGGLAPANGLIFDGYNGTGDASTTSSITASSIEGVKGIGLWLKDANNFTVTAAQIGSNIRNLQVDDQSNANLFTGLFETAGSNTSNVYVSGSNNTFSNVVFSSSGGSNNVEFAGVQTSVLNSEISNGTFLIDSNSVGAHLIGVGTFNSDIVDHGTGTMLDGRYNPNQGAAGYPSDLAYNTPQFQRQTPASDSNIQAGAHFDAQGMAHGLWVVGFSSPAVPVLSASNYSAGKAWAAVLVGSFIVGGSYTNTMPPIVTITDAAPTLTFGGAALTFSVDPTTHQFKLFSTTANVVGFSGTVFFMPNNGVAAGTGSTAGFYTPGSIQSLNLSGTGNAVVCAKADGTLYRGTANTCP